MNNEELENSLRTEIDNYLRTAVADLQSEIIAIQDKVSAELERSRSNIEQVLQEANSRDGVTKIDDDFARLVAEHLQIAREDSANAINKVHEEEAAQNADGFVAMRDAVNDIGNQISQAEILKTLVKHAASFASRGALFIIKSEHLVGWRIFGNEKAESEEAIREVFMSLSSDTLLGAAVKHAETQIGSFGNHSEDSQFLTKLEFGEPNKMTAVPLIVRGRGVAVLYADAGTNNGKVQTEALESLVRVASLTVELLASTRNSGAAKTSNIQAASSPQPTRTVGLTTEPTFAPPQPRVPVVEQNNFVEKVEPVETFQQKTVDVERQPEYEPAVINEAKSETAKDDFDSSMQKIETDEFQFQPLTDSQKEQSIEAEAINVELSKPFETSGEDNVDNGNFAFADAKLNRSIDEMTGAKKAEDLSIFENYNAPVSDFNEDVSPVSAKNEPTFEFESNAAGQQAFQGNQQFQPASTLNLNDFNDNFNDKFNTTNYNAPIVETQPEPPPFVAPVAVQTSTFSKRFGERNVDLPIDVPESDRRLHNDARRFARLLVSEIKLYNEQKVKEGRQSSDLYDRLREAIDRSREMYDKRVSPPVASKFDYFNFELVNTLAEGDIAKLGTDYPGATA